MNHQGGVVLSTTCPHSSAPEPEQSTYGAPVERQTPRLILRRWRPSDRAPFAEMNADPVVMEHYRRPLTRRESDAFADWIEERWADDGIGLFAVEVKGGPPFVGYVGLDRPTLDAPFMPAVEIGWRLAADHWGHGYATEAARETVRFAFDDVGLDELVSFTTPQNVRSRAVMQRIGMTHDPTDDFDHPRFMDDERLRRHVLYRIDASAHAEV